MPLDLKYNVYSSRYKSRIMSSVGDSATSPKAAIVRPQPRSASEFRPFPEMEES